jgi:hypothetical protein
MNTTARYIPHCGISVNGHCIVKGSGKDSPFLLSTLDETILGCRDAFRSPSGFPRCQQSVESPRPLCYRDHRLMKTDRQLGSEARRSSEPAPERYEGASAPQASAPTAILIANLELESNSTHRKHSPLTIPNRKFSRFFISNSALNFGLPVTHHSSLATEPLIYGSAIRTPANPQGFNDVQISNRR